MLASAVQVTSTGATSDRKQFVRNCALLALLGAAVYAFFLDGPFLSDDEAIIASNPHIRRLGGAWKFFTPRYWNEVHQGTRGVYRPLREVTFALLYRVAGHNPLPYHLLSLVAHLVNVLLLYALARRLLDDFGPRARGAAFLAAALFAVHPAHFEAVLWAKNFAELQAAFFVLTAFIFFLEAMRPEATRRRAVSFGAAAALVYALALLCKESGLALAPVLLLYALFTLPAKVRRKALMFTLPFIALALAYLLFQFGSSPLVSAAARGMKGQPEDALALRPALVAKTYAFYHWLLLFPVQLCAQYSFVFPASYTGAEALPYLVAFAGLAGAIGAGLIFWRRGAYLLLWSAAFLAPAANLIPFKGRPVGDQRLYVPSIGFCLLFGAGAAVAMRVGASKRMRWLALGAGSAVVALMAGLALARGPVWRAERSFWLDMLRKSPIQAEANRGLGQVYWNEGRYPAALVHASYAVQGAEQELAAQPGAPEYESQLARGLVLLGKCLGSMGEHTEAAEALLKAVRLAPQEAGPRTNLGVAYLNIGKPAEALAQFQEALRLEPNDPEAHIDLAMGYQALGRFPDSFAPLQQALALDAKNARAHDRLGISCLQLGQLDRAFQSFAMAVSFEPNNPVYLTHLAAVLLELKRPQEAERLLRRALTIAPGFPPAQTLLTELGAGGP